MKLHEYQAKHLLRAQDLPVSDGRLVTSADEAAAACRDLGGDRWVVKAQIHAGGRGKAGGVKLVDSPEEARDIADGLLGQPLVTKQTGPEGQVVSRVWVEPASSLAQETYIGILIDRTAMRVHLMAAASGGVGIEELAEERPEAIIDEIVDPAIGLRPFQTQRLAEGLGVDAAIQDEVATHLSTLYQVFMNVDASLLEINPYGVTTDGRPIIVDAKIVLDDNALFRHHTLAQLRDTSEEIPAEVEAADAGLSYIPLSGNIGCLVNGAGLAMATMDLIKVQGGEPANFLDVGGGAKLEQVRKAFELILRDTSVKAILVNIFGGIMRCDVIAQGIIDALQGQPCPVPLVVRLEGTEVEEGRRLLAESQVEIQTATMFEEAAKMVVAAAQ